MSERELLQIRKIMDTVRPDDIVGVIVDILRSGYAVESTIARGVPSDNYGNNVWIQLMRERLQ